MTITAECIHGLASETCSICLGTEDRLPTFRDILRRERDRRPRANDDKVAREALLIALERSDVVALLLPLAKDALRLVDGVRRRAMEVDARAAADQGRRPGRAALQALPPGVRASDFVRQEKARLQNGVERWMVDFARRQAKAPVRHQGRRHFWGDLTVEQIEERLETYRRQRTGVEKGIETCTMALDVLAATGCPTLNALLQKAAA